MSKTYKDRPNNKQQQNVKGRTRQRAILMRAVRRNPPDLRKLGRALIDLAIAQDEADAQAEATRTQPTDQAAQEPSDD